MMHVADFSAFPGDFPVIVWHDGNAIPGETALRNPCLGEIARINPYGTFHRLPGHTAPEEELVAIESVDRETARKLVENAEWQPCVFLELVNIS